MSVLVTGADGFVGRWLVRRLLADGREVVGAVRPAQSPAVTGGELTPAERDLVRWLPLELTDPASVARAAEPPYDAVVHLAAVASGSEARRDPGYAWTVNAGGTARVVEALAAGQRRGGAGADPIVLVVSTGEVYGTGGERRPRTERDPVAPCSPYAASKAGAELAALEAWRRTGLRVVVARAFAHTGPGQDPRFVVPAFAERLRLARHAGAPVVKVGNLDVVRDFLDVRDVVDAYVRLLAAGAAGEIYNVASGQGVALETLFFQLAALVGGRPIPEVDPDLMRGVDLPYLVGDATKLRAATGWAPRYSLDATLRDLLDAQAD
ncbi:MAG TPA: NAD-dependent epimerase/dehydratase family protein [Gemmatimonadales bacterium]|nr:NAD-dependent epimerase/dehydratase family protein [Gemmatimonadales bacterium]